jgi:hypothetical protein
MDEETSIFIDKLAQTGNSIIVSSAIITAFLYRAEMLIQKGKTKEAIAIYDTMKNHPTGFTELHEVIVRKMNLMREKDKNIVEGYFSKDHEHFLIEADRFLKKGKSGFKGAFANISLYLENKLSDDSSRDMINNMLGIDPYRSSYRESGMRDAREFSRAIKNLFANDDDPEIKKMFEETDSTDNTGNSLPE